jgi:hypothetical protein
MDQSKKTMRHFYCRDVLWETFEQMANDFDCSIDYLINEAMRYYARSKNYQSAMASAQPPMQAANPGMAPGYGGGGYSPPGPPHAGAPMGADSMRRPGAPPPPPMGGPGRPMQQPGRPPGPGPMGPPPGMGGPGPGMGGPGPGPGMDMGPGMSPAPPMPYGQPMSAQATLYLIFNNQRYPITKDQFIIGRGSKTSDLPIKDGNISRKHAAVIRRNGTYYIKDLGSTNGIDYKGMRIDNKRIDEGDVFHLCDYELRFTYRPD